MATLSKSFPASSRAMAKRKSDAAASKSPVSAARRSLPRHKPVAAAKAKTHLLELLDTVDREGETVTITKRGRPVAKLVPIEDAPARSIFGCMKGTFRVTGDILGPEPDIWEAML